MKRILSRGHKLPACGLSQGRRWTRQARMLVAAVAFIIFALQAQANDPVVQTVTSIGMTVSDVDRSVAFYRLKFYRDLLGMKVIETSENYGTEQEHLNNVFGARLQITTLRAESGPGVELLEYISPRHGRLRPPDARPNDLLHWQTTVAVRDLKSRVEKLRTARTTVVSPDVTTMKSDHGSNNCLLVRDPDGHAVILVESVGEFLRDSHSTGPRATPRAGLGETGLR